MSLGCGEHQAFIVARGGTEILGQLDTLIVVQWNRKRDAISDAFVTIGSHGTCCDWLGEVRVAMHELHLYRDGVKVWEGPVTRIEFTEDEVNIFAEDILWVPKMNVLSVAYSNAHPNVGAAGARMLWLLKEQTFAKYGDPWNMVPRLHRVTGSDEPMTAKAVKAYSCTTFEDFDKFAEDSGMDYTVVGRDVYFWDTHLRWRSLSPLYEDYLQEEPAVVEYGNQFATRVIVTNGNGVAAIATAEPEKIAKWGYVDQVVSTWNDADGASEPTAEDLLAWQERAEHMLDETSEPPNRVRVSENTGLTQESPYSINDLIPGSWVTVSVTRLCRNLEEWHKLDSVQVREENGKETVQISTITAPSKMVEP